MRTKVTLLLIFLNAGLFFYIFQFRRTQENRQSDKNLVLGPETANIQTLEISAASDAASPIKIERIADTWMLAKPLQWPANEFAVTRIISELQQLQPYATFTVTDLAQTGQSLADYGLEKPPLTLTFTAANAPGSPAAKPITLKIGAPTKVGNRLYVLSPDGKSIHVVNHSLAESLSLHLEDLRADTLFTIPVFEVRAFRIQPPAPAAGIRISNDNTTNRWLFESPFKTNNVRANKTATVLAINELHKLKVKTFLDRQHTDTIRTGLATPELQITLNGNNRHETLLVGLPVETGEAKATSAAASAGDPSASPTVEYYAQMDDKSPVFTVAIATALLEKLRDAQEKLRDPHILDLEPATVTAITLSAPNQSDVTLQRLESPTPATAPWQFVRHNGEHGPQTLSADRELVERLLQKLTELTAERFVDDAPSTAALEDFGFNRPARQIAISRAKAQAGAAVTLQIGATSGAESSVYAKLLGQPYVYRVSTEILQDTPVSLLAYRDRLVRELPAGAQITGLKLTDIAADAILLETTLAKPASTTGTMAAKTSREAIDALVTQLRTLRAKIYLREEFTNTVAVGSEERPWHYRLDITLSLVGGTAAQTTISTLYFSERTGGTTQYVGSPDLGVIFEAAQPLLDTFFVVAYGPKDPGPTVPPTTAPTGPSTSAPSGAP